MNFRTCVMCSAVLGTLAAAAPAGVITLVVPESSFTALTGQADSAPAEIATDGSGRILVVDQNQAGNDRLLRFDSDGTNGVLIQTEDNIVAAIELVNGTSVQDDFSINGVSVAADGDIILTNGDGGGQPDGVVAVANAPLGAITVLSTAVNGTPSPVEGINRSTVIGNTVYIAVNDGFTAPQDAILSLDTNGAGAPAIAATVEVNEATLTGVFGVADTALVISAIEAGGSGLYIGDSGSASGSDSFAEVVLPGGATSILVSEADILADISDTDTGFSSLTVDGAGSIWVTNNFGGPASDDGIIKLVSPGGGVAQAHLFPESQVVANVGGTEAGPGGGTDGIIYDAAQSRILVTNSAAGATEGIIAISQATVPAELSGFNAD